DRVRDRGRRRAGRVQGQGVADRADGLQQPAELRLPGTRGAGAGAPRGGGEGAAGFRHRRRRKVVLGVIRPTPRRITAESPAAGAGRRFRPRPAGVGRRVCYNPARTTSRRQAMFDRISNGIALARSSWAVLMKDKHLIVFPIVSGILFVLVVASFAVPLATL